MPLPSQSVEAATHVMPEAKPPWAYWYSPWNLRVHVIDGKEEILPILSVTVYDSGANGCIRDDKADPREFGSYATDRADLISTKKGLYPVPVDIEFKAWGKTCHSYLLGDSGRPWKARPTGGRPGVYFQSAFERPRIVAGRVKIEYDQAGFLSLLRAVAKIIGPLYPDQIEAAREATPQPPKKD